MARIYYIEDDRQIAGAVEEYLSRKGFSVKLFPTLAEGEAALANALPELLLLDWNLPDGRGDLFCRSVRRRWKELPVIFLTVRGEAQDMVAGFREGADDYVGKPFELEVLCSRIRAVLKRAGGAGRLSCGAISLDPERKAVSCGQEEISLSPTEYQILLLLLKNQGRTVSRELLLEQVWDQGGSFVNDNTLTVAMKRLREKLGRPACLKTVRSFGYCMEDDR